MLKKLCWSLALGQSLLWIGSVLLPALPAAAYTTQDSLTVYWLAGEDYTALARRAELAARTAAQRQFDTDILLTRVVITVLGQNGGQVAPILKLDVGRSNWRARPDPRYWSKYYRSTPALLGLEGVVPTGTLEAVPAPVPVAPASSVPNASPGMSPTPAPESAPGAPVLSPGSSASPSQSVSQPANSGAAPVINLPAVPAGAGIPAILR